MHKLLAGVHELYLRHMARAYELRLGINRFSWIPPKGYTTYKLVHVPVQAWVSYGSSVLLFLVWFFSWGCGFAPSFLAIVWLVGRGAASDGASKCELPPLLVFSLDCSVCLTKNVYSSCNNHQHNNFVIKSRITHTRGRLQRGALSFFIGSYQHQQATWLLLLQSALSGFTISQVVVGIGDHRIVVNDCG